MELTQIERMSNTLTEIGEDVQVYSEQDLLQMIALIDNGSDLEEALERYEDIIMYEVNTLEELAGLMCDEGLFETIPESLINYIDYEAIGRDLQYDYNEIEIDGTTYFYNSNY